MADWTGRINESSSARGVWMRATGSSGMVEELPSLPGDLDDVPLYPTVVEEDTEITDTTAAAVHPTLGRLHPVATPRGEGNRAPATLPPPPQRLPRNQGFGRPQPQALYDEAPDPFEKTPPTFDMGLVPNTSADLDVTETGESRIRSGAVDFASAGDPGSAVFDELPLLPSPPRVARLTDDVASVIQPIRRISAREVADRDVISEVDLDEEWLEIELPIPESRAPESRAPEPRAPEAHTPAPARSPAQGRAAVTPPAPAPRVASPSRGRIADRAPAPGGRQDRAGGRQDRAGGRQDRAGGRQDRAGAAPAFTARAPVVQPSGARPAAPVPAGARLYADAPVRSEAPSSLVPVEAPSMPAVRPDPFAFDASADTAPLARMPITVGVARVNWLAQAGWWCAGAVVGVSGASAIAGLTFVAVILI